MLSRVERRERLKAIAERNKAIESLQIRNKELHKHIDHLEKMIEGLVNENCALIKKVDDLSNRLEHELKNNDVLVKHSHVLFNKLAAMEKIRMVLPNVKTVTLDKKYDAHMPTQKELEDIFKGEIARGKKN